MSARRALFALGVLAALLTGCVPNLHERLDIEADGSGEFTVTWFATPRGLERPGFLAAAADLGTVEFAALRDAVESSAPEALVAEITGVRGYQPPDTAELDTIVADGRVGLRYRERFSSLGQLQGWSRSVGADPQLAPIDPDTGRLSLLALWGLEVVESADRTTLTISAADHWKRYLTAEFGDAGPPDEGALLRIAISVEGEVIEHNADGVDGAIHLWTPTVTDLESVDPLLISWQPKADDEGIDNRTIAFALLCAGGLIGVVHLFRRRRH